MSEEKISPELSEKDEEEGKESENEIYGLEYYALRTRCISINVLLSEDFSQIHFVGYTMTFVKRRQGKFVIYTHPYGEEYDRVELDSSKSLVELANEHFKHLLQSHQHQIKRLVISGGKGYDFEIKSLSQLETIDLLDEADTRQFLSKVQHPLRCLKHESEYPDEVTVLFNIEQAYQVKEYFSAYAINYDQMTRLSANTVETGIEGWNPKNLFKFVKAWENDETQGSLRLIIWFIGKMPFDAQEFFKLFGDEYKKGGNTNEKYVKITNKKDGRTARLTYSDFPGSFMMNMQTKKKQ